MFGLRLLVLLVMLLMGSALASFQLVRPVEGGFRAYCSGAVVDRVGVTAGHCVDDLEPGDRVYVRDADGRVYNARLEESCFEWPRCDHALLSGAFTYLLENHRLGTRPEIGELVQYTGGPYAAGLFRFTGTYVGPFWDDPGMDRVHGLPLFNITAAPGSSGSIILNRMGDAVAILVGGAAGGGKGPSTLIFAIWLDEI